MKKKGKKSSLLKNILIAICILFIIIFILAAVATNYVSSKINKVEIDRTEVVNTGKTPTPEENEVITIALLGSDYSGTDVGASDATMILAVDTKNNKIKLMSLMRDIYLDLPAGGKENLNYTLVSGGPELTLKTINYNFALQVDKFVHVNLHTLPKIIDVLGGVELDITNEELAYINGYIKNIDKENGTSTEPLASAGKQVLNGTQASAYCRIRSTEGKDYKRTERQRYVLDSLYSDVKNISITQVPTLLNELLPLVTTNMSTTEMISIASKVLSMGINNIEQTRFPTDEDHYAEWTDMYHMIIDKESTTKKIHNFIYSTE